MERLISQCWNTIILITYINYDIKEYIELAVQMQQIQQMHVCRTITIIIILQTCRYDNVCIAYYYINYAPKHIYYYIYTAGSSSTYIRNKATCVSIAVHALFNIHSYKNLFAVRALNQCILLQWLIPDSPFLMTASFWVWFANYK